MDNIVVDTHVLVWMFIDPGKLPPAALGMISSAENSGTILIPAISLVELVYLAERGRISDKIIDALAESIADPASAFRVVELSLEIARRVSAIPRGEIPEMPDRIIAATSHFLGLPLVNADNRILACSAVETIWDQT